jgi:hypothetical protein
MDRVLRDKWVAALRSGEYVQGQGALCEQPPGSPKLFCCLGVLADVAGKEWLNARGNPRIFGVESSDDSLNPLRTGSLGDELLAEFGLTDSQQNQLIDLNDSSGWPFSDIANWVEREL